MSLPAKKFTLSWRGLEARVPLDDLPDFHRAFLSWRGVEGASSMPLRRVQQRVEAELNKWVQSGQAVRSEGDLLIERAALTDFAAARPWLSEEGSLEGPASDGSSG